MTMRLPIVQFPSIVVNNLVHFAPVFATEEQVKHFCEYVTGLIAGDKATIAAINALFLNKNDQFPVNFRLYLQFRQKQELATLREEAAALVASLTLGGYHQYLVDLLSFHLRRQPFRPKTQLAADRVREAVCWGLPFDVVLFNRLQYKWTKYKTKALKRKFSLEKKKEKKLRMTASIRKA